MCRAAIIGVATARRHNLLTSSHPNASLEESVRFADTLTGEFAGKAYVVEV
jgi:hypothetical protein